MSSAVEDGEALLPSNPLFSSWLALIISWSALAHVPVHVPHLQYIGGSEARVRKKNSRLYVYKAAIH